MVTMVYITMKIHAGKMVLNNIVKDIEANEETTL